MDNCSQLAAYAGLFAEREKWCGVRRGCRRSAWREPDIRPDSTSNRRCATGFQPAARRIKEIALTFSYTSMLFCA